MSREPASTGRKLFLVGGGKMGLALLGGWLKSGRSGSDIVVIDPAPSEALLALAGERGISVLEKVDPGDTSHIVVLAVKPQIARDVVQAIAPILEHDTLIVSIMAGISLATLRTWSPTTSTITRAMPNLPAAVGRGVTVAVTEPGCSDNDRAQVQGLLSATGVFEWLDSEDQMDAVTALSGSGPAYIFYLVECLALAGTRLGLDARVAERLARSTAEGAGELLHVSASAAGELREEVTSPQGTTEAGLRVLMDGRLQDLILATLKAAAARSQALSE